MSPPPPPDWHQQLLTVGITGTNGKTTTTRMVAAVLSLFGVPVPSITTVGFFLGDQDLRLAGSYESFLKTLRLGLAQGARHAAIELSSEALARGFIHAWPCQVGVFTNLTRDHLDAHGNAEHYLASKAQLFHFLPAGGTAILNGHDESSPFLAEIMPEGTRPLFYGVPARGPACAPIDFAAQAVSWDWHGTSASISTPRGEIKLHTRAIGSIFMENALAALGVAFALDLPLDAAAAAIALCPPPKGRFEVLGQGPHVVIDYAHTPDALTRTLETARALTRGSLTVVFGAGGNRDREKRALMGAAASQADRVVVTSDNPRDEPPERIAAQILEGVPATVASLTLLDRRQAITQAIREAGPTDVVVIAGKGHETNQTTGKAVLPFSDHEVARSALELRQTHS